MTSVTQADVRVARGPSRLLVVEDDPISADLIQQALTGMPFDVSTAETIAEARESLRERRPHIVLLDMVLPDGSGMELLSHIVQWDPSIEVVLMTGHYSTDSAVEAIQKGARDYITKPLDIAQFCHRMERWLAEHDRNTRLATLEEELVKSSAMGGIVGRSPAVLELFGKLRRIAPHFSTVLIWGETGTGKEMVARALHELSGRPGPLVVCNCATISESLFESELFGHEKGSFTGAHQQRKGLVEAAEGGTLFLDEVAEIPLSAQAKLLRLLQNREIQRVGSTQVQTVDVSIVAATHRDLKEMVEQRQFREDLYYRLSAVRLSLPPLSARLEDLPLLQQHFLRVYSERYGRSVLTLSRKARAVLAAYSWPGNIRELENVISYACMMAESEVIDVTDFPDLFQQQTAQLGEKTLLTVDELIHRHVRLALQRCRGNRAKAAELIGMSRATLYRILSRESSSSVVGDEPAA